jgi:hypothetical protein
MMTLDLNGRSDTVNETAIVATRDAATARAASSSQLRDLSLMLDAALAGRSVPLRRKEVRVLRQLADDAGISALTDVIRPDQ